MLTQTKTASPIYCYGLPGLIKRNPVTKAWYNIFISYKNSTTAG